MSQFIELLGLPFLACLLMVGILGYAGIHVLKREVIFIDIALAQIAAVGAIVAHLAFHAHGVSLAGYGCAFAAVVAAAAFYAFVRRRVRAIPLEAVIGVTYAVAAAAALFLVGVAPGGHVHVHQMLAGSLLWATWRDVVWCAAVFAGVGLAFALLRGPLGRISEDYEGAVAAGVRTVWWDFVFYTLVGLVITLSVRVAGVVVVFAFLIIPSTLSALFASGWAARLAIAWATGVVGTVAGLWFAMALDFSLGPSVAAFLGALLALAGLYRLCRPGGEARAGTAVGPVG